ncbi:hypothetical protein CEG14_14995 [Bordetella genomosp. 1]|uniref:ParB/Spo0J HTH domain-containing protein n=1 Tax=Bordetella genomosp. 1 TaxID=1395607 RepID=A0A261SGN4_9BORD|nr:hypothetical protein [Bordetella genomosp. 1]OZI36315.1 hypothetical protein CEG14_14995 [Bordetella genomosp. 1]
MTQPTVASFKTMTRDGTIKRADAMKVLYRDIHVVPEFNLRDHDDEYHAGIAQLADYIMAGGMLPPLEVVAKQDGSGVELVDGHRRHAAYGIAIQRGAPIEWVSIVAFSGNQIDRYARIYTSNESAKLRPLEAARGYLRFLRMGLDVAEIARHTHKSRTLIESYLILACAPPAVQDMVRAGTVSAEVAIDGVRQHGDGAAEYLAGKAVEAKARGKARVTAGTIRGRALPKKVVAPLITGVDAFMAGLTNHHRAAVIDAREGRVAPETIDVPVSALADLLSAHDAVQAARLRQEERDRSRVVSPPPQQEMDHGSEEHAPT